MNELNRDNQIGDRVTWSIVRGDQYEGVLEEWDSNIAVVRLDNGETKCVECKLTRRTTMQKKQSNHLRALAKKAWARGDKKRAQQLLKIAQMGPGAKIVMGPPVEPIPGNVPMGPPEAPVGLPDFAAAQRAIDTIRGALDELQACVKQHQGPPPSVPVM